MLDRVRRVWSALRASAPIELQVREAYARWAASYPTDAPSPYLAVEQQAVLQLLPDLAGAMVLDLACGTGRYAKVARARGAAAAIGLDLSREMLRPARAVASAVARGDLAALPFRDGVAAAVICGLAVGHLPQLGGAIAEISRVLKPGGVVVYSDFHPFAYHAGRRRTFAAGGRAYAVAHHVHLYAAHQGACRGAGLEIDAVVEPTAPDGLPAVLVVRARKCR